MAVRDLDELNAWQPDLIVLDEAQRIKNWESKTSRAVKKLRSRYAMVLTGTPLENKLEELYSIVQFVDDRRLGPAFQFLHDHRVLDDDGKLLGYRNLDKIREKLAPILLRRTRAEVLSQLPARTDTTVYVEMAEAQRGPYAEHQPHAGPAAAKEISHRDGSPPHPRLHHQPAHAVRQHVSARQADERIAEAGGVGGAAARIARSRAAQGGHFQSVGGDAAQGGGGGGEAGRRLHDAARRHPRQGAAQRCWSASATSRSAGSFSAPTRAAPA